MTNSQATQIADCWRKREQEMLAELLSGWVEVLEQLSSTPNEAPLRAELARCLADGRRCLAELSK